MRMWVRVKRGLAAAGLLLAVLVVGFASDATIAAPKEPAARTIVVEGNRRVEADTIRS